MNKLLTLALLCALCIPSLNAGRDARKKKAASGTGWGLPSCMIPAIPITPRTTAKPTLTAHGTDDSRLDAMADSPADSPAASGSESDAASTIGILTPMRVVSSLSQPAPSPTPLPPTPSPSAPGESSARASSAESTVGFVAAVRPRPAPTTQPLPQVLIASLRYGPEEADRIEVWESTCVPTAQPETLVIIPDEKYSVPLELLEEFKRDLQGIDAYSEDLKNKGYRLHAAPAYDEDQTLRVKLLSDEDRALYNIKRLAAVRTFFITYKTRCYLYTVSDAHIKQLVDAFEAKSTHHRRQYAIRMIKLETQHALLSASPSANPAELCDLEFIAAIFNYFGNKTRSPLYGKAPSTFATQLFLSIMFAAGSDALQGADTARFYIHLS